MFRFDGCLWVCAVPLILANTCATLAEGDPSASSMLTNPGITGPFSTIQPPTGSGKISGEIAQGWQDNSGWADVRVRYAAERQDAHGGDLCQRIDVEVVRNDGKVQFMQPLQHVLTGHTYRVSAWLRETAAVPVDVAVRQCGTPYSDLAASTITPGGTWAKAAFDWYASGTDAVCLMIRVEQPVTLWVRDAAVAETKPVPAPEGNLLPNGSFETGPGGGWGAWVSDGGFHDSLPARDATTAFTGKSSLKIDIPPSAGTEMEVSSPPVIITQPGAYTASLALKVANGPAPLSVSLENSSAAQTFVVGDRWQRVTMTGMLQPGPTRLMVRSTPWSLQKVTAVWVDAAELSLRSSAMSTYVPANPVELSLATPQPGHLFFDRSPAILQAATAGDIPPGSRLHVVVTDLYGNSRALPPVSPSKSTLTITPDQTHPYGMFKATAILRDPAGQALSAPVECAFARLPKPRELPPAASFFGVHMPLLPGFFPIARAIGARWVRLHDASQLTKWTVVQPNPGPFRYFDLPIVAARGAGLQILGMLDGAPAWTTTKPNPKGGYWAYFYNNPDAPGGQKEWADYVNAMVSHYKGMIDNWEVWNEPWNLPDPFFPGSPEQYGDLLKTASTTARTANPKATILGIDAYRPGANVYSDFTRRALQASGSAAYDVFSYHDYAPDTLGALANNVQLNEAKDFLALQKQFGNGPARPQWTTEGGVGSGVLSMYGSHNDGATLLADQGRMVRFLVSLMASGSARFFLYTLYGHPKGSGKTDIVVLEYDRSLRPQLAAYAVLASLVDGAGAPTMDSSVPGVCIFRFPAAAGSQVNVLWSFDGRNHELPCPPKAKALDIQCNPLPLDRPISVGPVPIYIVTQHPRGL